MSVGWKKYTRFRFPGVFKKWGKFSIVVERLDQRWWQWINMWNPTISQEVSRNLPVGPCSNHPRDICFEADYQRIVKQKIEIQLYIISGEGSFGVWKTEEAENNFFSTSQGKRNIVLISTHKMSLSVIIFEIRISALLAQLWTVTQ